MVVKGKTENNFLKNLIVLRIDKNINLASFEYR